MCYCRGGQDGLGLLKILAMAILKAKGLSGRLGDVVLKQYADKTVATVRPDRCRRTASELQLVYRECFTRARQRASRDKRNGELVEVCRPYMKKGQALYHFLLKVYGRQEIRRMEKGLAALEELETVLREEFKVAGGRRSAPVVVHPAHVALNYGGTKTQGGVEEGKIVFQTVGYGGWVSTSTAVLL